MSKDVSRPGIEPGSQELASCAITARPPQHDTTGPRHRAFDVFQGSCYMLHKPRSACFCPGELERQKIILHLSRPFEVLLCHGFHMLLRDEQTIPTVCLSSCSGWQLLSYLNTNLYNFICQSVAAKGLIN